MHETFSLCLGLHDGNPCAGISLRPSTSSNPRVTCTSHTPLRFRPVQQAALAKRLHLGHSTAPSHSSRLVCVTVSALCPISSLSGALRNTQVLNGTQALIEETILGDLLDVFRALECPGSSCTALQTQPVSNVFNMIHTQVFLPPSAHSREYFLCIHPSNTQRCEEWGPYMSLSTSQIS